MNSGIRIALLALLLPVAPVHAADDASAAWGIVSVSGPIEPQGQVTRWRYDGQAQWRNFDRGAGGNRYVLRGSASLAWRENLALTVGYDFHQLDPDGAAAIDEHRLWQQLGWKALRWNWGSLALRTRLEERMVEDSDDVGLRLRQQLALTVPLPALDLSVIASTEPFVNVNSTDYGADSGFDRIRSYLGVRMPMTDTSALEAGYLHDYIERGGQPDALNHTALLHLRFTF